MGHASAILIDVEMEMDINQLTSINDFSAARNILLLFSSSCSMLLLDGRVWDVKL